MSTVLRLSNLAWKIIFFCIQVINFSFLVAAMDYDYWFKQKWENRNQHSTYRGSLLINKRDLGFCNLGDSLKFCYDECRSLCDHAKHYKDECMDFCERFGIWHNAGVIYIVLGTIASAITVLIAVLIILAHFKIDRFNKYATLMNTAILMFFVLIFHVFAFVSYTLTMKLKYDSNCEYNYRDSGAKNVCSEGGGEFALFILIWLLVVVPGYFFIALKLKILENSANDSNPIEIQLR